MANAEFPQEIDWLDLTGLHPCERIRGPHASSGECGGGAGFEGGPSVDIILTYLDKTSYSVGEEVTYEAKRQNIGREPVEISWTAHLGELEPADPSRSYTYLHAAISLVFVDLFLSMQTLTVHRTLLV